MKRGFVVGSLVALLFALGLAPPIPCTAEDIDHLTPSSATAESEFVKIS